MDEQTPPVVRATWADGEDPDLVERLLERLERRRNIVSVFFRPREGTLAFKLKKARSIADEMLDVRERERLHGLIQRLQAIVQAIEP